MEQLIREIVSEYINVPITEINDNTIIDRSKVSSSIVLHRMYAKLAESGFNVENYWNIKTIGHLLHQNKVNSSTALNYLPEITMEGEHVNGHSVGIDIEEVKAMPIVVDFREDEFYKMNFSESEISHCILSSKPYASFAGLFALKEAVVKCDNSYRSKKFNTITVDYSDLGKPLHPDFQISLSHTNELAIAIAISTKKESISTHTPPEKTGLVSPETKALNRWIIFLPLIISIAALIISILKHKPD